MREMETCTCNGGADIMKNNLLTECQTCGGLKPIDNIVTVGANGERKVYKSLKEYENSLKKDGE